MFDQVVGLLLNFQYGSGPLTTQSMDNWLYGWSDPVLTGLYGAENSWVSLETNATYYGSNGLSTGDYSVYEETTSENGGTPGFESLRATSMPKQEMFTGWGLTCHGDHKHQRT